MFLYPLQKQENFSVRYFIKLNTKQINTCKIVDGITAREEIIQKREETFQ